MLEALILLLAQAVAPASTGHSHDQVVHGEPLARHHMQVVGPPIE